MHQDFFELFWIFRSYNFSKMNSWAISSNLMKLFLINFSQNITLRHLTVLLIRKKDRDNLAYKWLDIFVMHTIRAPHFNVFTVRFNTKGNRGRTTSRNDLFQSIDFFTIFDFLINPLRIVIRWLYTCLSFYPLLTLATLIIEGSSVISIRQFDG